MTLALPTLATPADLERLSAAGERYELIKGELIQMSPVGGNQGNASLELATLVNAFLRANRIGRGFTSETGFLVAPETVLAPDLGIILHPRVPRPIPDGWIPVIPDLVLETRAPGVSEREVRERMQLWLSFGVKVAWDLDPKRRQLTIYQPELPSRLIQESDSLTCEELLPGFVLPMRDVFEV